MTISIDKSDLARLILYDFSLSGTKVEVFTIIFIAEDLITTDEFSISIQAHTCQNPDRTTGLDNSVDLSISWKPENLYYGRIYTSGISTFIYKIVLCHKKELRRTDFMYGIDLMGDSIESTFALIIIEQSLGLGQDP